MKTRSVLLTLAIIGILAVEARAQTPAQSFEDLSTQVSPGTAVVVTRADGRHTDGKVVSIASDRIEIRHRRWNFRTERLSFFEPTVVRIERRDSTWNGELMGTAVGAAVAWTRCRATRQSPDDFSCLWWIPVSPAVGSLVGGAIDRAVRRPLYVAGARVQLRPIAGRGVSAAVRLGF